MRAVNVCADRVLSFDITPTPYSTSLIAIFRHYSTIAWIEQHTLASELSALQGWRIVVFLIAKRTQTECQAWPEDTLAMRELLSTIPRGF